MRKIHTLISIVLTAAAMAASSGTHPLTEVFHDDHFQITGISMSKTGRLFVNYPRWSDHYLNAVVEVTNGTSHPYPDESWNRWDKKAATAGQHFVCVQSVVVDDTDALWVLDPAAPLLGPVVQGGPKMVKIDLKSNQVARVYPFGSDVIKPNTYLNDVRFDTRRNTAYITDSGVGGIIVVDLTSGKAHRALDGHPSVMAVPNLPIAIDGKALKDATGKPPQFQSDGIALSPDGQYLYYQAISSTTLYRVKTEVLRSNPGQAGTAVEKVASTFPVDGIWMDSKSRIYLTGLTQNGVLRLLPNGSLETLVTDPRLQWPDTFTEGPDGAIYVSASHINESPTFNQGVSVRKQPYGVFQLKP